jgi:hypothetical protein
VAFGGRAVGGGEEKNVRTGVRDCAAVAPLEGTNPCGEALRGDINPPATAG